MGDRASAYERARFDLATHLIVEAGAGAGKTEALTQRYAYAIVRGGCTPGQILAVTFTRKAAAEMRQRSRQALGLYLHTGAVRACWDAPGDVSISEADRQWIRAAMADLGSAPIDTFHGFCAALLRRFPIEARVDPGFTVLDPAAASLRRSAAVEAFLESILGDPGHERFPVLIGLLDMYDYSLVCRTVSYLNGLAETGLRDGLSDAPAQTASSFFLQHPLLAALWPPGRAGNDEAGCAIANAVAAFRAEPTLGRLADIGTAATLGRGARDAEWKDDFRVLRDDLLPKLKDASDPAGWSAAEQRAQGVWAACRRLASAEALQPFSPAELDYNGLERKTLEILGDPERCARIRQDLDLRHILVDEYQDTNHVQRRILYYLTGCTDPDAANPELRDDAAMLFCVGDPKQSIYRFRGAQVEVFSQTARHITACFHGARLALDRNYRSSPKLIAFYNHLFSDTEGVFSRPRDAAPADYEPVYQDMRDPATTLPGQAATDPASPAVFCHLINPRAAGAADGGAGLNDAQAEGSDEAPPSQDEVLWIAEQIRRFVGHADPRRGTPLSFRDIAVLKYSVQSIQPLRSALQQAQIPYYVVGSRGLMDSQEVEDVCQWLRLLARPDDDLALAACAKQPWIGLTDAHLLALHSATVDALRLRPELEGAEFTVADLAGDLAGRLRHLRLAGNAPEAADINAALERLQTRYAAFLDLAGRVPAAALAEEIIALNGMRETWACWRRQGAADDRWDARTRVANLERFLELLRQGCRDSSDLFGLIRYLDEIAAGSDTGEEAQLVGERDDVVRIMTIHQAKGLEFPVVFVMGLDSLSGRGGAESVVTTPDGLSIVRQPGSKGSLAEIQHLDPLSLAAAQIRRLKDQAERRRLLYVATTRARSYLCLSGTYRPDGKETDEARRTIHNRHDGASWLVARFGMREATDWAADPRAQWPPAESRWLAHELPCAAPARATAGPISVATGMPAVIEPIALPTSDWQRVTLLQPSGLTSNAGAAPPEAVFPAELSGSPVTKPRGAENFLGDLFHRVMAEWDFQDGSLDGLIARLLAAEFREDSPLRPTAEAFLRLCVGNFRDLEWRGQRLQPIFAQALAQGRLHREWPFTHRGTAGEAGAVTTAWISGKIDVVLEQDGCCQVFDYKTGFEPPAHYAAQMHVYREALQVALGPDTGVPPPLLLYVESRAALPAAGAGP